MNYSNDFCKNLIRYGKIIIDKEYCNYDYDYNSEHYDYIGGGVPSYTRVMIIRNDEWIYWLEKTHGEFTECKLLGKLDNIWKQVM